MLASVLLLILVFSAREVTAQPQGTRTPPKVPEGTTVHRDLAYVAGGHERQKLDLYLPRKGENLPLIIWVHGGAFRAGSKEKNVPFEYLEGGYAVASVNYRLSQHALFPAQIEDVKAAGHGRFTDPKVAELTKAFLEKHLKPTAR